MSFTRVLIAIDNHPSSLKTAEAGFELAQALDAQAGLLYTVDRTKENINIEAGPTRKESETALRKEAQTTIEQLAGMYKGKKTLSRFTPEGLPKEEILNVAADWKADLIVMGNHARSGLSQLFNGSIEEHVVNHASMPVLVIPHINK